MAPSHPRGLLLAAGAGRRMGTPKGLLRMPDGTPWVERGVRALIDGGCDGVTVVVGAAAAEVSALLPDLPGVDTAYAADWAGGMSASLVTGLTSLADPIVPVVTPAPSPPEQLGNPATVAPSLPEQLGNPVTAGPSLPEQLGNPATAAPSLPEQLGNPVTAAVVLLVDLPDVGADVVARVLAAGGAEPAALARAAYEGRPGHPVLIGRDHWAAVIAEADGDAGARSYLERAEAALVECGDLATGRDVDRPGP